MGFKPSNPKPLPRRAVVREKIRLPTVETAVSDFNDTNPGDGRTDKSGSATISNTASTQAVSFATAFSDTNYAIAVAADGNELVWFTGKTTAGFTLNRAGTAGDRVVNWTATPYRDP